MRTLYLDPFSGIAGDMLVGALLDLGASFDVVREGLGRLDIGDYELSVREVHRGALRATKFEVRIGGELADSARPGHDAGRNHTGRHHTGGHHTGGHHGPDHPAHGPARGLPEIRSLLEPARLPPSVTRRALAVFERLAAAEGRVHGADPETVHFHEVGAVDAICDIVGAALALEDLAIDAISCGPLRVGSGFIQCAHGTLPAPGPATLECLAGFDVQLDQGRGELVTPTGAALVGALAQPGAPRSLRVERVGYGAGTRDPEDVPNVLRAVLGMTAAATDAEALFEIRTNVDHIAPNILAEALEAVRAAGALEVYSTAVAMKKGRAGQLVTALAPESTRAAVESALFRETGTLGVRRVEVARTILERSFEDVVTPWGTVPVKLGRHAGNVTSREPEMEDCRRLAAEHGVPVADVAAAARKVSPAAPAH